MKTNENDSGRLTAAVQLVKRRKLFFIPLALGILLWIAIVILTDEKNIAPFVYSTY